MKYIGENAIKKLISLIKGDLATKQPTITASGLLKGDGTGTITAADTQEATLVDVPNGLLKGDGTTISAAVAGTDYVVPSTALNELPGHLANGDIHVTAEQKTAWNAKPGMVITEIPKGRMRGDIKGIGKVGTSKDIENSGFINKAVDPTNPDSWACDVNADSSINISDVNALSVYDDGRTSILTKTPTFADFYNNWTYHKVDDLTGYWTTDLAISGITAETDVSISVQGSVRKNAFIKAEPLAGGVRIHANYPPIRALPCSVTYGEGTGQGSICAVEGIPDLEKQIKKQEIKFIFVELNVGAWDTNNVIKFQNSNINYNDPTAQSILPVFFIASYEKLYRDAGITFERKQDFIKCIQFKCETVPTETIYLGLLLIPTAYEE